ncbi:hypothetical protein CDAR_173001 [Caerostris darwini]|uniref:Uncharacterized protein n=1 Tax=Caerostris darwini TaxID=1538125 RepID=A0AAV4TYN0_9ARAC|nr:hypothetical protein CDAR_173001 [Caerostris darwini]
MSIDEQQLMTGFNKRSIKGALRSQHFKIRGKLCDLVVGKEKDRDHSDISDASGEVVLLEECNDFTQLGEVELFNTPLEAITSRHKAHKFQLQNYEYDINTSASIFVYVIVSNFHAAGKHKLLMVIFRNKTLSPFRRRSPDERSIMSADGTVPTPPPPRWSTGIASTVLQVGYG